MLRLEGCKGKRNSWARGLKPTALTVLLAPSEPQALACGPLLEKTRGSALIGPMAKVIEQPTLVEAAGVPSKTIEEYIGRVNSDTASLSIARMKSPSGWSEPGQKPEFDEFTVVLHGVLHIRLKDREFDVAAGQAVSISAGEWVQYSSPHPEGAEYLAVCLPAFSPELVHRDQ